MPASDSDREETSVDDGIDRLADMGVGGVEVACWEPLLTNWLGEARFAVRGSGAPGSSITFGGAVRKEGYLSAPVIGLDDLRGPVRLRTPFGDGCCATLVLHREVQIEGVVVDRDGSLLPMETLIVERAKDVCRDCGPSPATSPQYVRAASSQADEEGRFQLSGLPLGVPLKIGVGDDAPALDVLVERSESWILRRLDTGLEIQSSPL